MIAEGNTKGFVFVGQEMSFLEYTDMIVQYFFSEIRAGEFYGKVTLDVPTPYINCGMQAGQRSVAFSQDGRYMWLST